jgi:hypothetical protein
VIGSIPEPLRALMALGFVLLLVLLRLDAQRFGAAEYDEPVDGQAPSRTRRLAWYILGGVLVLGVMTFHPSPSRTLYLGSGDRGATILLGLVYALIGAGLAAGYSWYRYGRIRLPDAGAYPGALVNDLVTAVLDEAVFRGALLGFLVFAGVSTMAAVVIQALVYVLSTRAAAPGRDRYMLVLTLVAGFLGGWVTVASGSFLAAFLGHAVMRTSVFLLTGHAGSTVPKGAESEEIDRRRRPPDGWNVIGTRSQTTRDR